MHPCWSNLPRRPLNGRRDVGLIMTNVGMTNGSHVNFTCNPYYELVGRSQLFCYGHVWETDVPQCRMTKKVCTVWPPAIEGNALMKLMRKHQIKHEVDYVRTQNVTVLILAEYICKPGHRFSEYFRTMYKQFDGPFSRHLPYQNMTCTGTETWTRLPVCIPGSDIW
jgi:hypothetical protein